MTDTDTDTGTDSGTDSGTGTGGGRRVVLHAGLPKTGTSALQVAFVQNREAMLRAGINYPAAPSDDEARQGLITTGNAKPVRAFLTSREDVVPGLVEAHLDAALGQDPPVVLFSSELIYASRPVRLAALRDLVEDRGATLEVVLCVRDIVPWVLSFYGQRIKRHRFGGTLGDYLDEFEPRLVNYRKRLETFTGVLGRDRVRVLHYESHRRDLVDAFFAEGIGVPVVAPVVPGTVNRALTAREVEWMRVVNRRVESDPPARLVSDALVDRPPARPEALAVGAADLERIRGAIDDQVQWVNDTFFAGRPDLSVEGSTAVAGEGATSALSEEERFLLEVCAVIASRVVTSSEVRELRVANDRLQRQLEQEQERRTQAQERARRLREEARTAGRPSLPARARARVGRLLRRVRSGG